VSAPSLPPKLASLWFAGTGKTYTFGGGDVLRGGGAEGQGVVGRAVRRLIEWAAPLGMSLSMCYVQLYMELLQEPNPTLTLTLDVAVWSVGSVAGSSLPWK